MSGDNPRVSIVVPVYNVEPYLNRCVSSLVGQTLQEIEIILVDDESPDKCPQLCDEWAKKDKRIKVIHKKNEGLGLTRNAGIKAATGEYVAFVDSDDFVELDMYERLYKECKHYNLDCIYSEFNVDDYPNFRVVLQPEKIYDGYDEIENLRLDIVGAEPSYISGVKYHCSSCKGLYLLELIKKHNVQFKSERQYISEDLLFNLDFLYVANKVKTVPWQYYHYCLNGASLSHTYRPDRWKKLLIMLTVMNDGSKFKNQNELHLRLKRTAIFYSMGAIRHEKHRNDISFLGKQKIIKQIISTKELTDSIKGYPISKLPIKWFAYVISLKYKLTIPLYMMV